MGDVILKIIILSIGIFAIIESLATMIFPQQMINIGKRWMKHVKVVRKIAIIELIVAIAFILIALLIL